MPLLPNCPKIKIPIISFYVQQAFLIETAPAHKFQMKKQLEEAEAELASIQAQIDDLYQQAEQLAANPAN